MTPPFDVRYNSIMSADLGFDSPVRSQDVDDYEFGVPSSYKKQADLISSEQGIAEENAMAYLQQALKKSTYVSPEQGFATALLGIIPTIGGYMIGKNVGQPDLPPGYFEAGGTRSAIGLDKLQLGGAAGGLAGLQGGLTAAGGYLKSLEEDQAQTNDIYAKMAAIESNKASRLQTRADQYEFAGLNKQAEIDMMPLREQSQMRIQDNAAKNQMDRALELDERRSRREQIPAHLLTKPELTEDDIKNLTTDQIRTITNFKAENRRGAGQEFKHDQIEGGKNIPGLERIEGVEPSAKAISIAQEAKKNYNQLTNIYIPELRRVFTDPKATTDDQATAIASAVIAIKNQENMGANFTVLEEALVKQGLPRIAEISISDFTKFLRAEIQGQDALAKIDRLQRIADLTVVNQLEPLGYRLSTSSFGGGYPQNQTGTPGAQLNQAPGLPGPSMTAGTPQVSGGLGGGSSQLRKPERAQNQSPESYLAQLKQYNAQVELLKKNGR